jgi:hypothetical protein
VLAHPFEPLDPCQDAASSNALMALAAVDLAQRADEPIPSYEEQQSPLLALWKAQSGASSTATALSGTKAGTSRAG